jgi:phosphatidate cytidylyltransferase
MLKTRIFTAIALLAVLLPVLLFNSFSVFAAVLTVFFAAAAWENLRLFKTKRPVIGTVLCIAVFLIFLLHENPSRDAALFALCIAIWVIRLVPSLAIGMPSLAGAGNLLLNGIYSVAILGCFLGIVMLFKHSPVYLLSVMVLVWIADIGAYFSGKAFGKHKLAPSISPGKSWEGAIGGWLAVLVIFAAFAESPMFQNSFAANVRLAWGWLGLLLVLTLLVAVSIVGDLFESQLKRRAGVKDSSNLLPGHGGVLDRIDALIPVLPLAALIDSFI